MGVAWENLFAIICTTTLIQALPDFYTLKVGKGSIKGEVTEEHVAFYGLNYAQSQRFKAPQALEETLDNLETDIDASSSSFAAICPQLSLHPRTGNAVPPLRGHDDCLKLNVFTKAPVKKA